LDLASLVERIRRYPWYAERIAGVSVDDVIRRCQETPQSNKLLPRFVKHVFG
jgi:hypothetical protein